MLVRPPFDIPPSLGSACFGKLEHTSDMFMKMCSHTGRQARPNLMVLILGGVCVCVCVCIVHVCGINITLFVLNKFLSLSPSLSLSLPVEHPEGGHD